MPEYTVLTVVGILGVLAVELLWWRTGLLARRQYWTAMAIVGFFQCLVDGWLTKLSDPIVLYAPGEMTGARVPWDIPIEDFGFGWTMITLTLLLWVRHDAHWVQARRRSRCRPAPTPLTPSPTRNELAGDQ